MHRLYTQESNDCREEGRTSPLATSASDDSRNNKQRTQNELKQEDGQVELRADATALFGGENDGGRGVGTGTTVERLDKGLRSTIGTENRDAYGRSLSARQRYRANRLRQWQRRSHQATSRERSLRVGLDEIGRISTALGTGKDIRKMACQLFRQATGRGLLIGRSIEGVASGCVYVGARTFGYPRSFDEVAHISQVDRPRVVNCYTTLRDEFGLELAPVDPQAYLPRIVSDIGGGPVIEQAAREIIKGAQLVDGRSKSVIGGSSPTSIAAAAVYAASVEEADGINQALVADAADVHVSTIRNNYPQLLEVYRQ